MKKILMVILTCALFFIGCSDTTENIIDEEDNMNKIKTFSYSVSSRNDMAENSREETTYYLLGFSNKLSIRIIDEPNGEHYDEVHILTDEELATLSADLVTLIEEHNMESFASMEKIEEFHFATDSHFSQELSFSYAGGGEFRWTDDQERPEDIGDAIKAIRELFDKYL